MIIIRKEKLPVVVQHYISQGLLKLFSENKNSVFEFNIKNDKIYRKAISTTMSDKKTYEHPFLEDNALENAFKKYEDIYIPQIKEIVTLLDNNDVVKVKGKIESLMKYILLFYYRSGAIMYEFSDNNEFTKEEVIENVLKRISDFRYLARLSSTIIHNYQFLIIKSPESELALSDQYVSTASLNCKGMISNYSNRTIGFTNSLILIPLSSKYYAIYYNGNFNLNKPVHNSEIYCLEQVDVLSINKVIVRNSYRKCIAMHQDDLEKIKSFKSNVSSPTGIIMKYASGAYHSCTTKKEVFFYDIDEDIYNNYIKYCTKLIEYQEKNKRPIHRNDMCICGSGKKYKKCCREKYQQSKFIMDMIQKGKSDWIGIKGGCVEKTINEFWGLDGDLPKTPQELIAGLRKLGIKDL